MDCKDLVNVCFYVRLCVSVHGWSVWPLERCSAAFFKQFTVGTFATSFPSLMGRTVGLIILSLNSLVTVFSFITVLMLQSQLNLP